MAPDHYEKRALSQNSVFLANRRWPVEVRVGVCVCETRKRNATHQVGSPQVVRERQSSLSRRSVSSTTVNSATAPVRQSRKTPPAFFIVVGRVSQCSGEGYPDLNQAKKLGRGVQISAARNLRKGAYVPGPLCQMAFEFGRGAL